MSYSEWQVKIKRSRADIVQLVLTHATVCIGEKEIIGSKTFDPKVTSEELHKFYETGTLILNTCNKYVNSVLVVSGDNDRFKFSTDGFFGGTKVKIEMTGGEEIVQKFRKEYDKIKW